MAIAGLLPSDVFFGSGHDAPFSNLIVSASCESGNAKRKTTLRKRMELGTLDSSRLRNEPHQDVLVIDVLHHILPRSRFNTT